MQITWKEVTGTQPNQPAELDATSSPSTVYLRRNIRQTEITSGEETIQVWKYEEAQLSKEEYEEYKELSQIFNTPEMEQMKQRLEVQEQIIAALAADAEYTSCMLESAGVI